MEGAERLLHLVGTTQKLESGFVCCWLPQTNCDKIHQEKIIVVSSERVSQTILINFHLFEIFSCQGIDDR